MPPFPLTPKGVERVAALFKAGGYLSFDNHMLRAKAEHVIAEEAKGEWSRALDRACKECMRSVGRGAGAARQSSPLDVLVLATLGLGCDPVVETGPLAPVDCVIAGTLFLLREIELLAARRSHVTIAEDQRSVTWLLPTSKTDPRAV